MRLGFQAIAASLSELDPKAGLDVIFRKAGMAFMGGTGGAIGVIFGKMLMSAAAPLRDAPQFGTREFKILLSEMELAVITAGKAEVGDNTILGRGARGESSHVDSGPQEQDLGLQCQERPRLRRRPPRIPQA